ncbi:DNRLRE domain-containing protein [Bacillus licheniformis]|uniref:DNRLRE domain-containing protein n=1 Tax=Bacillus licheniformis TaxID=1402 RepID=UPI0022816BDB|nr:DNRLRE domain-containing protein [Bacillus licheniformis]MCY8745119.1 DNRLRE domain-containing protein [Bacillus licheniformis]
MTYPLKGLVLHLHSSLANEGTSQGTDSAPVTSWYDLTGSGNTGYLSGFDFDSGAWVGSNSTSDPYALYFNGIGSSVAVKANPELLPSDSGFTLETWIKPSKSGYVLSLGDSGQRGFSLYYDHAKFELTAQVTTSTKVMSFVFSDVGTTSWSHITLLFDGDRLWGLLNAAPKGFSLPQVGEYLDSKDELTIGKSSNTSAGYFEGKIAIVRVYSRALEWEEVSESYASGLLITTKHAELHGRGTILWRKDLTSSLDVSSVTKMRGKYNLLNTGVTELVSAVNVTSSKDMICTIDINPIARLSLKYDVTKLKESDLPSRVDIKAHTSLSGTLNINTSSKLEVKYAHFSPLHQPELTSNIYVKNRYELLSAVTVYPSIIQMGAKYKTNKVNRTDLTSSIKVKRAADLNSGMRVNVGSGSIARVSYNIKPIHTTDLSSKIFIQSTGNLTSSVNVASTTRMQATYGIAGIIVNNLPSKLTISSVKDLSSSLEVSIKSCMRAKYQTIPQYFEDLYSTLGVNEVAELYGEMFISFKSRLHARYEVTPIYFSSLPSEITVRRVTDLSGNVIVNKMVEMRASYNLIERPKFGVKIHSDKDAFVREFFPKMNYGSEISMYTGKANSPFPEKYRSLVGFNISPIPKENTEVGKATLRLYYDGRGEGYQDIQAVESGSQWTETGVTWANHPAPAANGFSVTGSVGGKAKYVEFDVTEIVKEWHSSSKPNFGLILKALDESEGLLRGFYTKEANERRPELEVTYYDLQVYSEGYSYILSDLQVRERNHKELKCNLDIKNNSALSDLESDFHVHQPRELECIIWINYPELRGAVGVSLSKFEDLPSSILIRVKDSMDLEGSLSANEVEKPSTVYVLYSDDVESKLTIRTWGDPHSGGQLVSRISISEVNKDSRVYILHRSEIKSDLSVRVWSDDFDDQNSILSDIEVSRSFELACDLEVKNVEDLACKLEVRTENCNDRPSQLFIKFREDLEGHGNIGNPNLKSSIQVWEKSILQGLITPRLNDGSNLASAITVPLGNWGDLTSQLTLRMNFDILGSVVVNSGNLQSFITVPINGNKSLLSTLDVRVKRASDLSVRFDINSGNFFSEMAVRVPSEDEINCSLVVKQETYDSLESVITVRPWVNLFSNISINKPRYKDIYSELGIRRTDYLDITGDLNIQSWSDPWTDGGQLDSALSVKSWGTNGLESSILVRRADFSDMPGQIRTKQTSEVDSGIVIRQSSSSDLISSVAVYELYELFGQAVVRRQGDPESEGGQLLSSITVRKSVDEDLDSVVAVYEHCNVVSSVTVRQNERTEMTGSVSIRRSGTADQISRLSVRQIGVIDLKSELKIRRTNKEDLPAKALIKKTSNLSGTIDVKTAYPYSYIM